MLKTRAVRIGGPKVHHHLRARAGNKAGGDLVHMYRDTSVAPILSQRRRLQSVLDVIQGIRAAGFPLSRGLELSRRWNKVITAGPVGTLSSVTTHENPGFDFSIGCPPRVST